MSDSPTHAHDASSPDPGNTVEPQSAIPIQPISSPASPVPAGLSPETEAVIEVIRRGLAHDADDAARSTAREICARIAQVPIAPPPAAPTYPGAAPGFGPGMPMPSGPESPITAATRALRQLPPEQLLDLVLQRLRAALPAGVTVPAPKGIQFQLLPVVPPTGSTR